MKSPLRIIMVVLGLTLTSWLAGCERSPMVNESQAGPPAPPPETSRQAGPAAPAGDSSRHALLVGCTKYQNLIDRWQLRGPGNDVALVRRLLMERFGFPAANIVALVEDAGADNRPTRANIEREFRRLAKTVKPGDQVLILFAGHGSQQPDQDPPDPNDPEPDGLDEIFLPADCGKWDGSKGSVGNAVVDDELRTWTQAILDRQASVVAIFDVCHSGTMMRGVGDEVSRQIAADQLIPREVLARVEQRAQARMEKSRGGAEESSPFTLTAQTPALAAIYAAQPTEETPEKPLPSGAADARVHGVLTYTLCQILTQASTPLTYAELVQRVQAQYIAMGRTGPTPLVEGPARDREVFGVREWPGRSRFLLARDDEGWKLNAGALHGLTAGSILAVYPPAGQANADKPLGHIRLTQVGTVDARVEPCAHGQLPAPKDLRVGGRCEPVYVDYGIRRLRVAAEQPQLAAALQALAKEAGTLVEVVNDPRQADWLLRDQDGGPHLLPAAGVQLRDGKPVTPLFRPGPGEQLVPWLKETLGRVARAQHLLALASASTDKVVRAASGVDVSVELLRFRDANDKTGEPVQWQGQRLTFRAGDRIGFRLHNRSRVDADVTLLFVDAGYGIYPLFPKGKNADNRLPPGKSLTAGPWPVTDKTVGVEHLVVIAVKAEGEPRDFTCLAQPTIAQAERTRGGDRVLGSPLGRLLQQALFSEGTHRGLGQEEVSDHALRLLSWQVAPGKRD
jgi:hypothetical protein